MPTPAQIDEQIKLERDQIAQGLKRLRDNTAKLESQNYASASIYGVTSIDELLPRVVDRIKDTTNRIKQGKTGRSFKEIQQYLTDLEPLAAAAISLKITFDQVFGFKEKSHQVINVSRGIGKAVEAECQMRHYELKAPGLLKTLKDNYWHKSCGTQQKIVVIQTLMNRYGIDRWESWGNTNQAKLGIWLLDCIMQESGWFYKNTKREGKRKTVIYIEPTPEFINIKDQVMKDSELFAPLSWPMLIEPNDWSPTNQGGYILNEVMRGNPMIRNYRCDRTLIQEDNWKTPIDFLNKIQKVGYVLNPFIVNVAETLDKKKYKVGKFIPILELPLPPKPVDIEDNKDSRQAYRRATADVYNYNSNSPKRACRTRHTMEAVKRFKGKEFFIPWSFDYRGRAYPIPAYLTPQDTDFGKSLIRFSNESVMGNDAEKWLAFQVATTYGLDKATMDERLEWVKNNLFTVKSVAIDPIDNIGSWEIASEPWQFLAACEEYYHCVILKDRKTTGLCVATDATCSGLQILAGLAMDKRTAQLVNVLPSDRPQDAYQVVADAAKPHIPIHLHHVWDRKKVKRTVMTIPYNAKPFSNRDYIREALLEDGIEISNEDLTQTVKAVREAMNKEFPGPMAVMKWIEKHVSKQIRDLKKEYNRVELVWETPSGFEVHQMIQRKKVEKLQLQLLGKIKMSVATDDPDKPDLVRHKAATAPNLIHSLDATLLHKSALRFCAPIALIHDSVLCRATDMTTLSTIVRETYMDIFAKSNYLKDFATKIGAGTNNLPIIGDLEPSEVIDSTYFFC